LQDIHGFRPAIKEIHALRGYLIQPLSPRAHDCDKHRKIPPRINAIACYEFPQPVSRRGRCDQRFRKDLTRRANHLHMFNIARIKPAPNQPRAFRFRDIFESNHVLFAGARERAGTWRSQSTSERGPCRDDPS
jgi:hypothetical protein